jgi:hypothetical protein
MDLPCNAGPRRLKGSAYLSAGGRPISCSAMGSPAGNFYFFGMRRSAKPAGMGTLLRQVRA